MPSGETKRFTTAALEQGVLSAASSPPHRANGVDDVAGSKGVPRGDAGFAGRAAAEAAAFLEEVGASRAMDGAVRSAPAEQRLVRGVDDRVHLDPRDVAFGDLDPICRVHVPASGAGGRWWIRTTDPCRVKTVLFL